MKYFGWKLYEMPVGELDAYQWVVRVEQLECFPEHEVEDLTSWGQNDMLDSMGSVSASNGNGDTDAF